MEANSITILDISTSVPLSSIGGAESVVYNLNKELMKRNFKITTICYSDVKYTKETEMGKVVVLKVPKNEILKVLIYPFKALLEARKYKADIIISEGPGNFGAGLLINLFAKKDAVYLERAHGTHYGLIEYMPKKSLHMQTFGRLIANVIERYTFKKADYSIAVSKLAANELEKYFGIDASKIKVIYNGIDLEKFKPANRLDRERLRRKLLIRKEDRCGIWVGGTDPYRKGLDIVLATAYLMKDTIFKIIGVDSVDAIEFMRKQGLDSDKLSNVEFLGKVPDNMKIKYYQASDFLIFPSRHEGCAVVPAEALACGLPIIISNMTGVNEIIKSGEQGFVINISNPEYYAAAIRKLDHEMGRKARKLALLYGWKKQAKTYADLLLRLNKSRSS